MSDQTRCTTEAVTPEPQEVKNHNGNGSRLVFRPHVDLVDSGDVITLWADLPGADESSVDVTLEKNTLTIKAKVEPPAFEGVKPFSREYQVGDYERSFIISDEIDRDAIEAVVTQGVLKLTLPKSRDSAMRKVAVKRG